MSSSTAGGAGDGHHSRLRLVPMAFVRKFHIRYDVEGVNLPGVASDGVFPPRLDAIAAIAIAIADVEIVDAEEAK